jgi:hypothetical protein
VKILTFYLGREDPGIFILVFFFVQLVWLGKHFCFFVFIVFIVDLFFDGMKITPGLTALFFFLVLINELYCDLDVGLK